MTLAENDYFQVDPYVPDADIIARQVVKGKRSLKKLTPSEEDLTGLIKKISFDDTMKGSSTLTVTVADPNFELMDSGFFDANRDGKLDAIDLNYPEGSDQWWRLTNCDISDSHPGQDMQFMERAACDMMAHKGPLKISRAKRTRAQFLKTASGQVKRRPIHFHSKDLGVKQPIDKTDQKKSKDAKKKDKDQGINTDDNVTFTNWDGNEYTLKPGELENADTAVDAIGDAPERAALACLAACIVEGPFFRNPNQANSDGDSAGILQLRAMHGSESQRRDIAWCVRKFMDEGFTGRGGATKLANEHKDWDIGQIAQAVQGSDYPGRYVKVKDGAQKVLDSAGGTSGGSRSYTKQYNFEIGSPENPNENFWDGSNRLAEEVKWAFFLDGQDLYFDPETTLIKQMPVAIITRGDAAVVSWNGTWDNRGIATELEITLICDMFQYRAGQVFKLIGFGPFSTGSTAKLPGRWLISEFSRDRYSLTTTFTLKQPQEPAPEPASEVVESGDESSSEGSGEGTDAVYAEAERIDRKNLPYGAGGHGQSWEAAKSATSYDCSSSTSMALHAGDMMKDVSGPQVSDWFLNWGDPGEGKNMTVWVRPGSGPNGHVMIQFKGKAKKRFDTGGGPPSGPHLRDTDRSYSGMTPRHWPGT